MENKVVKYTKCRNVHSSASRIDINGKDVWYHNSCAKCFGRIATELSAFEYEQEVSKQQRKYPSLRNKELRPDWIHEAFKAGTPPIEFLNGVISDCFLTDALPNSDD